MFDNLGEDHAPLRRAVMAYSIRNRHRKASAIKEFMNDHECRTVLMVGAVSDHAGQPNMGIVERAAREGREVKMGINVVPATGLDYPFTLGDACDMPFEDGYVDFALSNAIIEHVGDADAQQRFVNEHVRVARCWVISTPNKWFPVESHTATVIKHWFPSWRANRPEFTRLLSSREFRRLLPAGTVVVGRWWSPTFTAFYATRS